MNNYIFNAHFDELWRLDLRSYQWRKVEPRSGPRPPKRALHSAVEIQGCDQPLNSLRTAGWDGTGTGAGAGAGLG